MVRPPLDDRGVLVQSEDDLSFPVAKRPAEDPAPDRPRAPKLAPAGSWIDGVFGRGRRRPNSDLIAALNDVASAVSSKTSVEDVLETIVERAKRITDTDKAALILTVEHSDVLDDETLVVKGSRDEHPESWWYEQLRDNAPDLFASGEVYLDQGSDEDSWMMVAPIRIQNRPVGLLAAINSRERKFSADQQDFLAILGAFAASAIENARLAEQTKYVLLASERDRIAREMHDGISQSLFSVALGLEVCKKMIVRDPRAVGERLDDLQKMVDVSRSELRRFIYDLRPVKLQELGLVGAIEFWIHEVTSADTARGEIVVTGEVRTLTPAAEACLYRVAKESVSNVVKHAQAQRFQVQIGYEPDAVLMAIIDDGVGFTGGSSASIDREEGIGLKSIAERIRREGGQLNVASEVGKGTKIEVRIPASP